MVQVRCPLEWVRILCCSHGQTDLYEETHSLCYNNLLSIFLLLKSIARKTNNDSFVSGLESTSVRDVSRNSMSVDCQYLPQDPANMLLQVTPTSACEAPLALW
jgi:hypothetical protein